MALSNVRTLSVSLSLSLSRPLQSHSAKPGELTVESIAKTDKEAISGRSIAKTPWRINQNERRILIDGLITPGYDPTGHAKECQDNLLIDQGFNNTSCQLIILADGHGKQGAVAAML